VRRNHLYNSNSNPDTSVPEVRFMTKKQQTDIILVTDGASRGNPGPAARAYLIYVNGVLKKQSARYLGVATNNVAEYTAILEGLLEAIAMQPDSFTIISDSELVVRQLQGRYQVRNATLKELHGRVMKNLHVLPSWTACHTSRENLHIQKADALCNEVLDKR